MKDFRLYVITGEDYHPGRPMREVMEAALRGGADFVQLRDKHASKRELLEKALVLRELTSRYGVPFVVNDHPDIALAAGADGVHLGQDDLPLDVARRVLGPDRIIGMSTHSIEQARKAVEDGADYIGVGPVFPTGTKPGRAAVTTAYVAQAAAEIDRIPFVAIGGITPDNAGEVLAAGAKRLCAVSAIVGSPDPEETCRRLLAQIVEGAPAAAVGGSPKKRVITVNGRAEATAAATLLELAERFGLADKRVVAELNGDMVPRASWGETGIAAGAHVEFVHFVGGG